MATHLTRSECEGFQKCSILNAVDRTEDAMLRHDHDEEGNVSTECEEDK